MAPIEMWVSASFLHEVSLLICFFFPFLFSKQFFFFKKKALLCAVCTAYMVLRLWDLGPLQELVLVTTESSLQPHISGFFIFEFLFML